MPPVFSVMKANELKPYTTQRGKQGIYIRPILMTPNLTNMTKITTLQALIESSMPAELKKCNGTRKKFAWKFKFAH